jgi:hypothetical protein
MSDTGRSFLTSIVVIDLRPTRMIDVAMVDCTTRRRLTVPNSSDVTSTENANYYSGPAKDLRSRSATWTANTAASVRCFIPIFISRFDT